jgi:pimeloyl-ACP methyl ester carboxylesterase
MRRSEESGDDQSTRPRRWKRGLTLLLVVVLLAAGLVLPYLVINDEQVRLDDTVRATAAGSFARLSAGYTHYEVAGPASAQTVVLVHGTTIPSFVWDHNFEVLAEAGLRVVRYDLYGRGLSDRPNARYDSDFFVNQLDELLAQVAPDQAVDLVGFSLGGIVVSEFAKRHSAQVRKVVLIAPAGVATDLPLAAKLAMAPGVGEYIMRVLGTRQLQPSRRNLHQPDRHPDFDATYLSTIRYEGSRRAVLESLRNMPFNGYEMGYRDLGALGKPILLVWGRHDTVVPFSGSDRVRELLRPVNFVDVERAGHLSHYERPEVVNAALLEFLADRVQPTRSATPNKAVKRPLLSISPHRVTALGDLLGRQLVADRSLS